MNKLLPHGSCINLQVSNPSSIPTGRNHDSIHSYNSSQNLHCHWTCWPCNGRDDDTRDGGAASSPSQSGKAVSAAYFAAAIWFAERELTGFAEHLRNEGKQEQEHAAKFADYLISRGQTVELDAIEAPRQTWPDPEEVIANVFRMEADVTTSVLLLYSIAERASDQRTTVFLDPVVDDQRISEHEAAYLLGRVKYANNERAAMMIIDAELREEEAKPAKLQS